MSFKFAKVKNMDQSHLLNTINCEADSISDIRKWECREELMKRWVNQQRPKNFKSKFNTYIIDELKSKFKQEFMLPIKSRNKPIDINSIVNDYL